jgi:putative peptidoglycan lipid II flippase
MEPQAVPNPEPMPTDDDASELIALHATDGGEAPVAAGAPPQSAARSAALVTAGILLSRLFGLVRQRLVGHFFGLSVFADVLGAAFRVGNMRSLPTTR